VINVLATGADDGTFPPRDAIPFSTAGVAKRFASRASTSSACSIRRRRRISQAAGRRRRRSRRKRPAGIRTMYVMQLGQLLSQAARTLLNGRK